MSSTMGDPDALLDRSPEAAVRVLALELLGEAAAAAGWLASDDEGEALHDLRVALRRLRTLLKAYRSCLRDSVSKRQARKLRNLARSTNDARDVEVQLDWLGAQRERLKPGARKAWSWLVARLEARRQSAYSDVRGGVVQRFTELEAELCRDLSRYQETVAADGPRTPFAVTVAERLRSACSELVAALESVRAPTDVEEAHAARILAKRLRYLLEPLRSTALRQRATRLVDSIKELQDVLGRLHDLHVLAGEIAASLVETATERARTLHEALYAGDPSPLGRDLRSGLLAIDRLVRDGVEALFAELRARWQDGELEAFAAEVEALTAALDRHGHRGERTVRRFLLAARPALEVAPLDVAQGWIPGQELRERVEHVVSSGEERFLRAVTGGTGPSRMELEEEASRELFERLWPLTEGRRVRRRRYRVAQGDHLWQIDEFPGRELVLASIELDGSHEPLELPDWLEPLVVREVTGDEAYQDESLAR